MNSIEEKETLYGVVSRLPDQGKHGPTVEAILDRYDAAFLAFRKQ